MLYYIILALSKTLCLLPRRVADALGRGLGHCLYPFVPKKRLRMAKEQVVRCLEVDEEQASYIVKESALRFGPMLFEILRFPYIHKHIEKLVTIEHIEYPKQALAMGRGGIIATGHTGNWELLGGALALLGIPLVAVAMRQRDEGADKFINKYRKLIGMHVTYKDNVREMFKMMREGWTIGLLADQDTSRKDGIILDFFGQATNCVPGPATMARSQDIPILPIFITRERDGRHRIICYPPIEVPHTKDKKEDIRCAMQKFNHVLEEHIRAHPTEWFWLHNRWKSLRGNEV